MMGTQPGIYAGVHQPPKHAPGGRVLDGREGERIKERRPTGEGAAVQTDQEPERRSPTPATPPCNKLPLRRQVQRGASCARPETRVNLPLARELAERALNVINEALAKRDYENELRPCVIQLKELVDCILMNIEEE